MRRCVIRFCAPTQATAATASSAASDAVSKEKATNGDSVKHSDAAASSASMDPTMSDDPAIAAAAKKASDARWRAQQAADLPAATGGSAGDKLMQGRTEKSATPFVASNRASLLLTKLTGTKLKPLTRTQLQVHKEINVHVKYAARLTPYNIEMYMIGSFLLLYMTYYGWNMKEPEDQDEEEMSPEALLKKQRENDPNRVPWPMLHKSATEIREGKIPPDEVQKIWDQVKTYYDGDWLIIVELTQFLKYSGGKFLSQFMPDPEKTRKEMMVQLMNVKYRRVVTHDNVGEEAREIIDIALEDLGKLSFLNLEEIPLVPTHST